MNTSPAFVTEPTGLTDHKRIFRLYARTTLITGVGLSLTFAGLFLIAVFFWGPESGRTPPVSLAQIPYWIYQGFGLTMTAPITWLGILCGWFFYRKRPALLMRPLVVVPVTLLLHVSTLLVIVLSFLAVRKLMGTSAFLVFPAEGVYASLQSGLLFGIATALVLRHRMRKLQAQDPVSAF